MSIELATWIVRIAGVYVALGVLFAVPFLLSGVKRIDPAAAEGTWGFRVLIAPGVVALWPLLLARWVSGRSEPPEEKSPHRCAAANGRGDAGGPS